MHLHKTCHRRGTLACGRDAVLLRAQGIGEAMHNAASFDSSTRKPKPVLPPLSELSIEEENLRSNLDALVSHTHRLAVQFPKNGGISECLQLLKKARASISEEDEGWPSPDVKIDWVAFGKTLKLRRRTAKLGLKELADMADISASMIRAVESAEKRPSRNLLRSLLMVPRLNLRLDDIMGDNSSDSVIPTVWFAPHYDPRQMTIDLVSQLNGAGCSLEQTTAYLDNQSADDWLTTCNTAKYLAQFSDTSPIDAIAKKIAGNCGGGGIDIIAIGCGDAKSEVKLVESLLAQSKTHNIKDIRLFLVDISHTLLTVGYNHAKVSLGAAVKDLIALHGNFHDLSQFPLFSHADRRNRCRVFTMLGCTLVNLDNEYKFFRDTMNAACPGDYFIADYTKSYASSDEPEQIRALDPPLTTGVLETHKVWLGGPIRRYTKGANAIDFTIELNTDCIVRGSYELVFVANVMMQEKDETRRFVTWRVRRYDAALLEEGLARTGWHTELCLPYGGNERQKLNLMLLRKSA